jgi:hypothetical protein
VIGICRIALTPARIIALRKANVIGKAHGGIKNGVRGISAWKFRGQVQGIAYSKQRIFSGRTLHYLQQVASFVVQDLGKLRAVPLKSALCVFLGVYQRLGAEIPADKHTLCKVLNFQSHLRTLQKP